MSAARKLAFYAAKCDDVAHWAKLYAAELDACHTRNGETACHDDNCDVHWFASKLWTAEQDMAAAREDTWS